ncbi:hypothetical protein A4A49_18521 [Nicotiana attenuata]|uniref:Uncharacterized protein n=1 Tax=Nicotiana attenuata TaxID=49451 RepID=A0A1J6II43_NICAT|nr:hypothetical protein A4A49_18521 [Nicotiana attenuata]
MEFEQTKDVFNQAQHGRNLKLQEKVMFKAKRTYSEKELYISRRLAHFSLAIFHDLRLSDIKFYSKVGMVCKIKQSTKLKI